MKRGRKFALAMVTCFFALMPVSAQVPAWQSSNLTASYKGFEGRPITRVEIAMKPDGDEDRIRSLLTVKPGEPFSVQKLQESVAAIQKNEHFDQIQASLEPDIKGLKLVLLLQPVFHFGLISFPGAAGRFSYTTLLQVSQIQLDAVYTPDALPDSTEALQRFFVKQGYFEASIRTREQPDPDHRLVNVSFECQLRNRARIGKIQFEGVSSQEGEQLQTKLKSFWARLSAASLKTGQKYSSKRIEKGMDRLRAYLRKSGHLAPKLSFEPSYNPDTNTADLDFNINPGAVIQVKLEGAHVWSRTFRKLVPIFQEGAADQDLIDEGARNLRSYFQAKSFFDATVTADSRTNDNHVTITYHVNRGARQRVSHILFTNNKYFSDSELQSKIAIEKAHFPLSRGKYSDALLKQTTKSLVSVYRNEGFSSVQINPNVTKSAHGVDVEFVITEGSQDKVQTINISDSKSRVTIAYLRRKIALVPGKPYSPRYLDQDRNQILAYYLNHGYPNATFSSSAAPSASDSHEFAVSYRIDEGQLVSVKDVVLLGEQNTRTKFLKNLAARNIQPSDPLNQEKLFESESDLYSLGVFDWASVDPVDFGEGASQQPVLIRVHESKLNSVDLGGGLEVIPRDGNIPVGAVAVPGLPPVSLGNKFTVSQKSFVGPRVSLQYTRHDIRGRAETAAIGFVVSRLDQRGSLTYADPYLHGSQWLSLFSVTAERTTENPIYTAALGQASFQIERELNKKKTQKLIFRYSYQYTDLTNILIPDLVLPEDQKVRVSAPEVDFIHDTRDHPFDAHHGQFQSLSLLIAPTSFGSSASFVRFNAQSSFYKPITSKLIWANNFRVGLAAPFNGSFVPISESFFSGGPDSLRGFPINGAGPQRPVQVCSNPSDTSTCTVISVPVGGKMLAIVNSEARFPLPFYKNLGGVVFYDGGNVYSAINAHLLTENYTNSIGIGLRYNTKVGPIRIDLGRNLNPIPGIKATQYFITLGQAF